MNPSRAATVLLVLCCLVLPAAGAGGITLTADRQDYYFATGERLVIPLVVTSTFAREVSGTVRFSTDEHLQKSGTVMISTEDRVFTRTFPPGESFLNLTLSPAQVPRDFRARIAFYYADPAPVNVSLPEIYLHVVAGPVPAGSVTGRLVSTSLPETGKIPASSSVSMTEQAVSVREQMGSDTLRGQNSAVGRLIPDAGIGQEQREREQEEFDARLAKDPLFIMVNRSLSEEGFIPRSMDSVPADNETGTFSVLYRRGAEDQVVVQGSMTSGVVPSVIERANVRITADPVLDANTTFQSFARTLADQEFGHRETIVNRTPDGAFTTISYAAPGGDRAFVNATINENRVIRLSLETGTGPDGFLTALVLVFAMAVLAVVSVYLLHRRASHRRNAARATGPVQEMQSFDYRAEADRMLTDAEQAFARGEHAHAYSLAGRALRFFLSHDCGDRGEITAAGALIILQSAGRDAGETCDILGRCSDVVFARGGADALQFSSLVSRIRKILSP